jgi:hypothetical protein
MPVHEADRGEARRESKGLGRRCDSAAPATFAATAASTEGGTYERPNPESSLSSIAQLQGSTPASVTQRSGRRVSRPCGGCRCRRANKPTRATRRGPAAPRRHTVPAVGHVRTRRSQRACLRSREGSVAGFSPFRAVRYLRGCRVQRGWSLLGQSGRGLRLERPSGRVCRSRWPPHPNRDTGCNATHKARLNVHCWLGADFR